MSPPDAAADDQRLQKALAAFVRQELLAPVMAIVEYSEIIAEDIKAKGFDQLSPDMERIHTSGLQLQAMVRSLLDPSASLNHETEEEFVEFRNKLRHDLRTPINAVRGYGEMLLEDMADDAASEEIAADLRKMLSAADGLLTQIDQLVNFNRSGDMPAVAQDPGQHLGGPIVLPWDEAAMSAAMRAIEGPADGTTAHLPPSRILVVDDTEANRDLLVRRVGRDGHIVESAVNGMSALEQISKTPFDLVLLDLMMPDISGYEVLCRLKRDPAQRHIPVIMISALDEIDSIARCIEAGAEDYLPKPFNPTVLRARIGASLEKKHLRDQARAHLNRLETELEATRQLQKGMVPTDFPAPTPERPVEILAMMEPAREVGGDLYDFFFTPNDELCFVVGDVSGKGVPAAFFMARTTGLLRTMVPMLSEMLGRTPMPAEVVERVNRELCVANDGMMFVTLFLAILDVKSGRLRYTNAGHNRPYIVNGNNVVTVVGAEGIALGITTDLPYESAEITLNPGEILYLFTDGITEAATDEAALFSEERLVAALQEFQAATAADVLNGVDKIVKDFCAGAPQSDDMTSMIVRRIKIDTVL